MKFQILCTEKYPPPPSHFHFHPFRPLYQQANLRLGELLQDRFISLYTVYFQSYERGPTNIFFCQIFADVYPDCNEIKLAKMDKNPLRNNLYAIDPDGAGGVPLFPAYCDFKTNERIGITEVRVPLFFYYIQGSSKSIFFFFLNFPDI